MTTRAEMAAQTASQDFDLCVIGGGGTGAGCALDAQLRGLKTVLLEAEDFGSATSSASTKLAHGGVRYLEQAVCKFDLSQYRVVKRALHERESMLRNASGLARPLQFLVPCHSLWDVIYYAVGLKAYDHVARGAKLAASRYVPNQVAIGRVGTLNTAGLYGFMGYTDGQFDDARFNVALVKTFVREGGTASNYTRVVELRRGAAGRIEGAIVKDCLGGENWSVRARVFLNATGPFSDKLRKMANPALPARLRLSRGVHIVLPLPSRTQDALLVPKTQDGRVIFGIPWLGRLLVGTTETEVESAENAAVTAEEADFLLGQLNPYLSHPYSRSDIVSAFAGTRPLLAPADSRSTQQVPREHEVEVDQGTGLLSVLGGKWTTYRAMAQDAIDAVQARLGIRVGGSRTQLFRLAGAQYAPTGSLAELASLRGVSLAAAEHLVAKFCSNADEIAALGESDSTLLSPLVAGFAPIRAEVVYAVEQEMALTLEDVLARRIGLQFYSWEAARRAAEPTSELMASLLGWPEELRRNAVASYLNRVEEAMRRIGLEPGAAVA